MMVSRNGRHYPQKKWAVWRDGIVENLATNLFYKSWVALGVPCKMGVKYWNGDRRRRDIPAMVDSLYHCFERAGLIADDSLIKELHWLPMGYDKANPRAEVTIESL